MELGPEDVSLLEWCPHFRGWYRCVPIREVSSFQRVVCKGQTLIKDLSLAKARVAHSTSIAVDQSTRWPA